MNLPSQPALAYKDEGFDWNDFLGRLSHPKNMSINEIHNLMHIHYKNYKNKTHAASGFVFDYKYKWAAIDNILRKKFNTTLGKEWKKLYDLDRRSIQKPLTEIEIEESIKIFYAKYKEYPWSEDTRPVPNEIATSWINLDHQMRKGGRGLPRKLGLGPFMFEKFNYKSNRNCNEYSILP